MFNQGNAAIVQEIQTDLAGLQEFIDRGDALDRLMANPDFQSLILEGYGKTEAHRLALATGNPNLQTKEAQADLYSQVRGIGHFMAYLRHQDKIINEARKSKREHLEELDNVESGAEGA